MCVCVLQINLFMCQFPFDLDRQNPPGAAVELLASYDAVLLNSVYSLRWYHSYSQPLYEEITVRGNTVQTDRHTHTHTRTKDYVGQ